MQATFALPAAESPLIMGTTNSNWQREISSGSASLTILPVNALAQARYLELLKARDTVWKAWFANDQSTLEKMLAQEAIAIKSGEDKFEHRAEILESAKQFAADGGNLIRLSFPHAATQFLSDVAILYCLWETETEANGKRVARSGRATEIFVHRNALWLTAGWHLDSNQQGSKRS